MSNGEIIRFPSDREVLNTQHFESMRLFLESRLRGPLHPSGVSTHAERLSAKEDAELWRLANHSSEALWLNFPEQYAALCSVVIERRARLSQRVA